MGFVKPGTSEIHGKVDDMIVYKRRDLDKVIVRGKGTLSKEQIRDDPGFEPTRKINREFGGRSRFTKHILRSIKEMKGLSDYNMAGPLNALLKPVQEMDTTREVGNRSVELARRPAILEGFPLNKRNVFETVVRSPLKFSLSKELMKAEIETPSLIPQVNFFPVDQYPVFRWQVCLASVSDLYFEQSSEKYKPIAARDFKDEPDTYINGDYEGQWSFCTEETPGSQIEIAIPSLGGVENFTLFLVIGIAFGTVRAGGPAAVKYAGCGKIIKSI
jgi:hypothetical protein